MILIITPVVDLVGCPPIRIVVRASRLGFFKFDPRCYQGFPFGIIRRNVQFIVIHSHASTISTFVSINDFGIRAGK